MIKAVVFDFDGTILDTETPWYQTFQEIYAEHGVELPIEEMRKAIGTFFDFPADLEAKCGRPVDREYINRTAREKHTRLMEGQGLRPGVIEYLEEAKRLGLKIGLASSSDRRWIEKHLAQYDLAHYFACVCTGDDVARIKPDPELYLLAVKLLGVSPAEALAIEDSANGAKAAEAAGLRCLLVPNELTSTFVFGAHDVRVDSLTDLTLEQVVQKLV